jgi:amino acid transporter
VKRWLSTLWIAFLANSLWVASIGIMLASSGIDGAYLAKIMNPFWLGYVLNTVSDVASEILMYWYGRLTQDYSSTKRRRAKWLLVVEVILAGFAWLFGWRQLLPIIETHDGAQAAKWLAPLMAAFTPVALIGIGYAQSLLAGRIEKETETQDKPQPAAKAANACDYCGAEFAKPQGVSAHLRHCEAYQAQKGEQ